MSQAYLNSARALLAVAFPLQNLKAGACTSLWQMANDPYYRHPHFMTRMEAAKLILRRNAEPTHPEGKGRRAIRRMFREHQARLWAIASQRGRYHALPTVTGDADGAPPTPCEPTS